MRDLLKRKGITPVILVTIGAIAFLPKQASQWVILLTLMVWCAINGTVFYIKHKDFFKSMSFKEASKKVEREISASRSNSNEIELQDLINQLSHRITEKLHLKYPEGSWMYAEKPALKLFKEGGIVRVLTMDTGDFDEADVLLDSYGRLDIKMLRSSGITETIKPTSDTMVVEPKVWYEQHGKQALTNIISEQNSQGTKSISIDEEGNVTIANNMKIATLDAFPEKNLWKKLAELFEEDELTVVQTESSIQLSW